MSCTPCPNPALCDSTPAGGARAIEFPGTYEPNTPWKLYNHLIAGIPEGVAVRGYCLGTHWSYVEADCGMGVAWTCPGGKPRAHTGDLRGLGLREVAELAKSWNFYEATLGVAALNAWYARPELLDELGAQYDPADDASPEARDHGRTNMRMDAFDQYRPRIEAASAQLGRPARVTVVGHFPRVERIDEYAELTVLERNCRDGWDTPDPACEYVMPQTDYAFITGVTLINKTAPRLLDLTKGAHTVMVGPSVVMSPFLFKWGVEMMAGSVVADPEKTRFAVQNGVGKFFGSALQMCSISAPEK